MNTLPVLTKHPAKQWVHLAVIHLALVTGILIPLVKSSSLRRWLTLHLLLFNLPSTEAVMGFEKCPSWDLKNVFMSLAGAAEFFSCACLQVQPFLRLPPCLLGLPSRAWMRASLLRDCCSPSCSHLLAKPPLASELSPSCPSSWALPLQLEPQVYLEARTFICKLRPRRRETVWLPRSKSVGTMTAFPTLGLLVLCQLLATTSAQVRIFFYVLCSRNESEGKINCNARML